MKNNIIIVSLFLFLLTIGSFYDTFNRIDRYGWNYSVKEYNNDVLVNTYTFDGENALFFGCILLIVCLNSFYVYYKVDELERIK